MPLMASPQMPKTHHPCRGSPTCSTSANQPAHGCQPAVFSTCFACSLPPLSLPFPLQGLCACCDRASPPAFLSSAASSASSPPRSCEPSKSTASIDATEVSGDGPLPKSLHKPLLSLLVDIVRANSQAQRTEAQDCLITEYVNGSFAVLSRYKTQCFFARFVRTTGGAFRGLLVFKPTTWSMASSSALSCRLWCRIDSTVFTSIAKSTIKGRI
mmetsp:Transcript_35488/g.89572  ORF Transcript_35488/g.89572 Transcript_35488/m.89572 type:complete len:213 (-) Transcript_35488:551-1189(-)